MLVRSCAAAYSMRYGYAIHHTETITLQLILTLNITSHLINIPQYLNRIAHELCADSYS